MIGTELTSRLIEDVQKAVHARNIATAQALVKDTSLNSGNPNNISDFNLEESNIRITCDITLPYSLSTISQFINHYETIILYKPGDKLDMSDFLIQAEPQKVKIADTLQKIKESPNLIFTTGPGHMQTLFSLIEDQLNEIHREAIVLENCYNTIASGKK